MSQHGCPERLPNVPPGFEDSPREPTMEVLVETLTGTAFEMTVSPSDTVLAIKTRIFRVEGIPVNQQHLLYNLAELSDGCSLKELGIAEGARLRLVLGLRGGPISTRRLPPPAAPWPDMERLERLLETTREDGAFPSSKVTVLVFRDGERVSMLRVRENEDGTYSPVDHPKYSSSLKSLVEDADDGLSLVQENAVTMGKMLELRRRMESMCVRRARPPTEKPDVIQKTRSEETLSVPHRYAPYSDSFAPLYDGDYTRYDYDCAFADNYTLLPPIGTRADSDQSVADASDLAGSILVKRDDDAALLESRVCVEGAADGEPPPATRASHEYGPLVVGRGWRARGFGSSSSLRPPPRAPPPELTCSTPDLLLAPRLTRHRNTELLHLSHEGLDVTRPRNLEVGSERRQRRQAAVAGAIGAVGALGPVGGAVGATGGAVGDAAGAERLLPPPVTREEPPEVQVKEAKKVRLRCGFCRKRLSVATVHTCRCGAEFCAPHRYAEVHGCAYDYKRSAALALARANPLVSAPKLPKI